MSAERLPGPGLHALGAPPSAASVAPVPVLWRPRQIWIDRQVLHSPVTANILRALPDVPTEVIDGPPPAPEARSQAALMTTAKRMLYVTAQRGSYIRACPGASSHNVAAQLCCGYKIVDLVYNCNFDCTYCYLQHYINAPYLTVYANIDKLFDELGSFARAYPTQLLRLGSGEFSDSLSLDPLTGFAGLLVPFLRQFPNVLFEFKTKSDLVDGLLACDPQGRVLVSWSLSPEPVVQREEHKTASLAARLRAAQRCRAAGYKIGLHFDPLLHYPGWEADYEPFVAQVFEALPPADVAYMSLGSLRFAPALKEVVRARFPKSRLMYAELFPGADNKLRYFKPLRTAMYARMHTWIRRYAPQTTLYLCMESADVWHKAFGHAPTCNTAMEQHIQQAEWGEAQLVPLERLTLPPRATH
ncbi:MAG: radical SAM protein [Candidatus Tectimicrobiota bacterium]